MKGFRKLVMLGVLVFILLMVINTIDAGKKQGKKKEIDAEKLHEQDNFKITNKKEDIESIKYHGVKKSASQRNKNYEEGKHYDTKGTKFESNKSNLKKKIKFPSKEKKYTENENIKTAKFLQTKSKVFEEKPTETFNSRERKMKKTKPQYVRSENVDNTAKSIKKTTQKKFIVENENEDKILREKLKKLKNEADFSVEETNGGSTKKRKYKLVEVVLEEDGQEEEQEGNETMTDSELEDQVFYIREELTETTKSTQSPKIYKQSVKKQNVIEEELMKNDAQAVEDNNFNDTEEPEELVELFEETLTDDDGFINRYTNPEVESTGNCPKLPDDPNRKGPKKLTLYVVEEEINGQVKKRMIPEEDGISMCEVADLIHEMYFIDPIPKE